MILDSYYHKEAEEVVKIPYKKFKDERGLSCKPFDYSVLKKFDMKYEVDEIYFSVSNKDVIRGMHFQAGNAGQTKILSVVNGSIKDVLIDLRKESKNFGKIYEFMLSEKTDFGLYIPKGFAHGFHALENETMLVYAISGIQVSALETGILWNSFGYDWKIKSPILSERDQNLPTYEEIMKNIEGNK